MSAPTNVCQQFNGYADNSFALRSGNIHHTLFEGNMMNDEHCNPDDEMCYDDDDDTMDDDESASVASIPDSDINFDFVYALHTFVATVEGQASVVKGDMLTLLDDTNSYWWLVNVVKTSEVGYIPAENIEVASVRQNLHYIGQNLPRKTHNKKVVVSRGLSFQLQIILTGEDPEEEIEEAFEEWEGTMTDENFMDSEEEAQIEHDDNIQFSHDPLMATVSNDIPHGSTRLPFSKTGASQTSTPNFSSSRSPIPTATGRQRTTGMWHRLFSRNNKNKDAAIRKENDKSDCITLSQTDSDSDVSSSCTSNALSDSSDRDNIHSQLTARNNQLTVLRVFAGNISVGATFNTVLVDEDTDADQLLKMAIERFRINDTENSTLTTTSRIEYYLTVKLMGGDEITLAPQDKPLAMFESLRSHLTTPMPSMPGIKHISRRLSTVEVTRIGVSRAQQSGKSYFGEDSVIKFYLHKRIKRVNETDGQVYVKISYYAEDSRMPKKDLALRTAFSTKGLKRKVSSKQSKDEQQCERIDKLVAVSANINMAGLTVRALDKFHITCDIEDGIRTKTYRLITDRYRIVLLVNGVEKPLNMSSKLSAVLNDDTLIPKGTVEKSFLLRKRLDAALKSIAGEHLKHDAFDEISVAAIMSDADNLSLLNRRTGFTETEANAEGAKVIGFSANTKNFKDVPATNGGFVDTTAAKETSILSSMNDLEKRFSVKIAPTATVDELKKVIKDGNTSTFAGIDAKDLTLWRVSIPTINANGQDEVLFDNITTKEELLPDDELSDVFDRKPPKKTVHIMVQIPVESQQGSDQRVTELCQRIQQLQEVIDNRDATCTFSITVKPERRVSFTWITDINTATLDKFKKAIFVEYPQFDDDDHLEIYLYINAAQRPTKLSDDEQLQQTLKVARKEYNGKLTISLECPSKNFSAWTLQEVCLEYGITDVIRPSIGNFMPFDGIQSDPLQTPLHQTNLQELIQEVRTRRLGLNMDDPTEATRSIFVASFLLKATTIFHEELYLAAEKYLSGRRGNGPVDYSVHSRQTNDYTLGVTEVKNEDFNQGVAQNVVQLESALTQRKRKRAADDVEGEENESYSVKSYGIVTDAREWIFIECTMDEDEEVSYRLSRLPELINYNAHDWEDQCTAVFNKLVWLTTQMKNEIPERINYHKKRASPSTSSKRGKGSR
ncbi:hypothetical protein DFQ28_001073 [Apophysomyces sp. BC1034]|nr:hypothetical protein DFQ29_000258 [Apophysomyces sp. BC1021]KAG0191043.1 hypothetical protein DFQ28_001073 [Apophysomyces sp. BC1034]